MGLAHPHIYPPSSILTQVIRFTSSHAPPKHGRGRTRSWASFTTRCHRWVCFSFGARQVGMGGGKQLSNWHYERTGMFSEVGWIADWSDCIDSTCNDFNRGMMWFSLWAFTQELFEPQETSATSALWLPGELWYWQRFRAGNWEHVQLLCHLVSSYFDSRWVVQKWDAPPNLLAASWGKSWFTVLGKLHGKWLERVWML
jgi:hypothetical protein